MSNTLLDSIPDEIINKVERCAQEGKSMWFVGGTEDQKKALFEIAHLERYNRDTFQIPSGEILPINIESVAPSRVIDCLSLEGFDCSTCDNVGLSILVQNNKKKEELIVKELDSYLNPPSMLQDNKVTHIHSVVKTLFFNNIPWFGTIILIKLKAIKDKMKRWEADGLNKILIVSFLDEIPDGCQEKLREWFEEIILSPEPKTEVKLQETKDEQIVPVSSYVFQEEDEFYFIRYESENFRLQKSDGLRYLHHLIMDSKTERIKRTKKTQLTPKRLYEAIKKVPKLPEAEEIGGVTEAWDKGDLTIESQGDYANLLDKETKEKIKRLEDEIYIGGNHLFSGYMNSENSNIINGYFKTGDLGYLDSQGYLFITGRKKNIINVGGFKVSALHVSETLKKIDGIEDIAVISIFDSITGEKPAALIVGKNLSKEKIMNFSNKNIDFHAIPKKIVFHEFIPKSDTGKIIIEEVRRIIEED